jgi:hypothetical protein
MVGNVRARNRLKTLSATDFLTCLDRIDLTAGFQLQQIPVNVAPVAVVIAPLLVVVNPNSASSGIVAGKGTATRLVKTETGFSLNVNIG